MRGAAIQYAAELRLFQFTIINIIQEPKRLLLMERAMRRIARKFVRSEAGATAIEYGLIAAIVGVGIITALTTMRNDLRTTFGKVSTELKK